MIRCRRTLLDPTHRVMAELHPIAQEESNRNAIRNYDYYIKKIIDALYPSHLDLLSGIQTFPKSPERELSL
jgi:hypothetical protein